jgi:DNA-binding HxlR family transcriptional regulator
MSKKEAAENQSECLLQMLPIRDALDAISGKWKMMILVSIAHGNKRFKEIERSIPKITSKVLAKELKDMEANHLINRTVHNDYPVLIEYTATTYSKSLEKVMAALQDWGIKHRKKIIGK